MTDKPHYRKFYEPVYMTTVIILLGAVGKEADGILHNKYRLLKTENWTSKLGREGYWTKTIMNFLYKNEEIKERRTK
jgi:hypothetical protein